MVRCLECGTANDFELGDGTGYCRVCGTQSQDIREEVVEVDETFFSQHNTSVRRVAKGLNSSRSAAQPDRIWTITEAVQIVLLTQTTSLIELGLPAHFKNVVGNLWFRFLAKIGSISVGKIEPVVLTAVYKISIFDNLALLYLALLSIHYPVTLSGLMNWISDGTICFFNTTRLLPPYFKPRRLLASSLLVKCLPTVQHLKQRVHIVSEILDDVPKPSFQYSVLERHFSQLLTKYRVTASDVLFLSLGIFQKFYKDTDHVLNIHLPVAASFLTSLRLHFQFENDTSDKESWLAWFLPYLQTRHKDRMSHMVGQTTLNKHSFITEKHFLSLTCEEYLSKVEALTSQMGQVMKYENVTQELKQQFSSFLEDKKTVSLRLVEGEKTETFRSKNIVRRGRKRKTNENTTVPKIQSNRTITVYPIDTILEESILPLELEILIEDVAGHFNITTSDLFKELQRLANLFGSI